MPNVNSCVHGCDRSRTKKREKVERKKSERQMDWPNSRSSCRAWRAQRLCYTHRDGKNRRRAACNYYLYEWRKWNFNASRQIDSTRTNREMNVHMFWTSCWTLKSKNHNDNHISGVIMADGASISLTISSYFSRCDFLWTKIMSKSCLIPSV